MRLTSMRGAAALASVLAMLVFAGVALGAFGPLPSDGSQVNNDPANGIKPTKPAGASDVAGGAVTAGNPAVPWATFEQKTTGSQQIFVRAFKAGAWVTEGFPASLNIDPTQKAEAPAIDFAGAGRAVPWVTWYEPNTHFGTPTNIFASRFNVTSNLWLPSGQDRTPSSSIPSLNIHTNRTAENPSVAGGAAVAGANPVPWVTWEESDGAATDATGKRQIFVERGILSSSCAGDTPAGGPAVNGFCWQQVGLPRVDASSGASSASGDPSLNVDPTRNGVEPDVAFTGPSDTVPWVVWYEQNASGIGLAKNEMVFAAKAVVDSTTGAGGFHWQAVGNGTAGSAFPIDRSGGNAFGACSASKSAERLCSLNKDATASAEDPRVAAGTLTPGGTTVPWVVWDEDIGSGRHAVFVSRLVGGDHFELFNSGQPVSNTLRDATRPDITFSGTIPYISWNEDVNGVQKVFVGHFEGGAAAPVFRLDTPNGISVSAAGVAKGLRDPLSSGCTANPFNLDGGTCQGGAIGTPFFTFADGAPSVRKLFADAYAPGAVTTKPATAVTSSSAKLHASVNPGGASVEVAFEFGTTTSYGSSTAFKPLSAATTAQPVAQTASGLPSGTLIHFRVVVKTDFTTVDGADKTFTTP